MLHGRLHKNQAKQKNRFREFWITEHVDVPRGWHVQRGYRSPTLPTTCLSYASLLLILYNVFYNKWVNLSVPLSSQNLCSKLTEPKKGVVGTLIYG